MNPSKCFQSLTSLAGVLCFMLISSAPAVGQAASSSLKDPDKARKLSIFLPGAGHYYAGERGKGLALIVGSGTALVTGALLSTFVPKYEYGCLSCNHREQNLTPFFVGAGIAGAFWLYGMIDSPSAARRANEKQSSTASLRVFPIPPVLSGTDNVGIAILVGF